MQAKTFLAHLAAALPLAIALQAAPTQAATTNIYINAAPPAPRHEAVPPARRGQVWVRGHWEWRDGRHVWVQGRHVAQRRGYAYRPARWVRTGNHWHYRPAQWVRVARPHR